MPGRKGSAEAGEGTPDGGATASPDAADNGVRVFYCDLCGAVMLNLHCKLTCERCGYRRDCSDP